jgi:PAS domain-containing protein
MSSEHTLLQRQLRRTGISASVPNETQWYAFLQRVDRAYREAEQRTALVDRTLAVTAGEMRARVDELEQHCEERVSAERSRMGVVLDAVTTALVMFDRGGRVLCMNSQAERLLGPPDELLDRHLADVVMVDGCDGTRRPLLARADVDEVLHHQRWERTGVRIGTSADVVIVPFADDPEFGGLVAITDSAPAHD